MKLIKPQPYYKTKVKDGKQEKVLDGYRVGVGWYGKTFGICPFTGKSYTEADIKSGKVNFEHILPNWLCDRAYNNGKPSALESNIRIGVYKDANLKDSATENNLKYVGLNIKNISLIASNQDLNNNNNTNNANSNSNSSKNSLDIKEIKPNTKVFITTFGQEGIVLTNVSKSNEVQVQIGIMKTNVNIKYLEKSRNTLNKQSTNKKTGSTASYNTVAKSKTVKSELNVIGLNVDEAIFVVDKFLDDSYLAKLETVRIVHGKGTGKLREGIHKYLKTHPHVKSFRIGTYGEGEMGVTVVTLK